MSARRIYKYALAPYETYRPMPAGAEVLSCGVQGDEIVVWAAVDPAAPEVDHPVIVQPTGASFPDGWAFLGTVQMDGGLVFHVLTSGANSDPAARTREGLNDLLVRRERERLAAESGAEGER